MSKYNQDEISIKLAEENGETVHHFKETTRLFKGDPTSMGCVPVYQCPCCEKTYYHTHPPPVEFDRGHDLNSLFDLAIEKSIPIQLNSHFVQVSASYYLRGNYSEPIRASICEYPSAHDAACIVVGNALIAALEARE